MNLEEFIKKEVLLNKSDIFSFDFEGKKYWLKKARATDSTSRLALKFDAIIIPIFTLCNDFRSWTIEVKEPIDVKTIEFKSDNEIEELTQIQNDVLTKQIFEKPDFWLWQHKRFKKYHNEIYKKEKN